MLLYLVVFLLVLASGTYLLITWLLNSWLRLRRAGHPFTVRNLLMQRQLELARADDHEAEELEMGSEAWAKRVAAPLLLAEIEREVATGQDLEDALRRVLARYRERSVAPVLPIASESRAAKGEGEGAARGKRAAKGAV